ncbi:MAG: hypothetical protein QF577_08530 [Phycisphaerae bacterium]|jgi:hypothetical protein|nr:hypothetical protein [Phycisphaerae bacterium]MDP7637578.1 hypothetical protein [Phycisphaerae bacterium]
MKAKRRHELQHNVLDAELSKAIEFLKRRGTTILWGVGIAALIVLVGVYVHRRHQAKLSAPQQRYDRLKSTARFGVTDPDQLLRTLETLADQRDNKEVAALASVDVGDTCAMRNLVGTKLTGAERAQLAQTARQRYQLVLREFSDLPAAVGRAHLGLAKLAETRRDFSAARVQYQAALNLGDSAGPVTHAMAQDGLNRLEDFATPVRLATTLPSRPTTVPVIGPTTQPASSAQP